MFVLKGKETSSLQESKELQHMSNSIQVTSKIDFLHWSAHFMLRFSSSTSLFLIRGRISGPCWSLREWQGMRMKHTVYDLPAHVSLGAKSNTVLFSLAKPTCGFLGIQIRPVILLPISPPHAWTLPVGQASLYP